MDSRSQVDHAVPVLTAEVIDGWFDRTIAVQLAEERLNASDPTSASDGMAAVLQYGRALLLRAVAGEGGDDEVSVPTAGSDSQVCVQTYLSATAAGIRAASAIAREDCLASEFSARGQSSDPDVSAVSNRETGAAPIAVAAGLLAGAAALVEASERAEIAEHHLWAPESAAGAAAAATAADAAADGADLAVTVRAAARAALRIHHGPTHISQILGALADVVAPQSISDLLIDGHLDEVAVSGYRICFSMDSSRWATPESLAVALRPRCSAFDCAEESGVCDVDLLTDAPGPVMELIIGIGTPYHLEIEHLADPER